MASDKAVDPTVLYQATRAKVVRHIGVRRVQVSDNHDEADPPLKESVVLRANACSGLRQLGFTDFLEAKEIMAIVEAKLEQDKIEIRYRRSARRFMLLGKARLAHQQRHCPDIAFPVRSRPANGPI